MRLYCWNWKVAPFNEVKSTRADGMHLLAEGYSLLLFLFMKRVEKQVFCSNFRFFCYVCLFRKLVSFELVFSVFSRCFVLSFCSSFVQVVKFLVLSFIFVSDESVLTAIEWGICWSALNCMLVLIGPVEKEVSFLENIYQRSFVFKRAIEVFYLLKAEI